VSWAKKHILGFSDEDIKLDLQQQRIEKAVGAELTNTAQVITHTGLFDNLDKLYGAKKTGEGTEAAPPGETPGEIGGGLPEMGGEEPAPPSPAPPAPGPELAPESKKSNYNILIEGSLFEDETEIDLSKARNSLIEMEDKLNNLLND
jgi:hypothetical protein